MASNDTTEVLQPIHPSMAGKLDPAYVKLYNENVANTPVKTVGLDELRPVYSRSYSYAMAPGPDVGRIYDDTVPLDDGTQLPIRVYEPESKGPWPVHVNFHGGGWALGDLDTDRHICQNFCKKANVVVIDVDYRLAPEFPFPTAIHDGFGALKHIHQHGADRFGVKTESISVGGVSAGGCIALTMAHLARDASIPLKLVSGDVPVVDDYSQYTTTADCPWPSARENEFAPTLNWARMTWFCSLMWGTAPDGTKEEHKEAAREKAGWFINLLKAPNFQGLARTLILTASADVLRDEGERYAQILVENGVQVTQRRFPGVPHPFMHMSRYLWQARECIDLSAREIRLAHWEA